MTHSREPIKHTCTDINKVLKRTDEILSDLDAIRGEMKHHEINETYVTSYVDSIANTIHDIDYALENLRKSNAILREWGIEEAEKVEELEEKMAEFEVDKKEWQKENAMLQKTICAYEKIIEQLEKKYGLEQSAAL